jgi:hypothetical protein
MSSGPLTGGFKPGKPFSTVIKPVVGNPIGNPIGKPVGAPIGKPVGQAEPAPSGPLTGGIKPGKADASNVFAPPAYEAPSLAKNGDAFGAVELGEGATVKNLHVSGPGAKTQIGVVD